MQLTNHPFFSSMDVDRISGLVRSAEEVSYPEGAIIFEEGSRSDGLYLVLKGSVAFIKQLSPNNEKTISHVRAGDFFGEIGLLTNAPRALSARAEEPVLMARISSKSFSEYLKQTPGPIEKILESIINHLRETTDQYLNEIVYQEKMAVVGKMANAIMHDFKNPFAMISLASQILGDLHKDEYSQTLVARIDRQIKSMVNMANELFEYTRGESKLHFATIHGPTLLTHFKDYNEAFFEDERIKIGIRSAEISFDGEESKLLRVLQNLIGNAYQALENEQGGTIEVTLTQENEEALFTITDDGPGIPDEIADNLFDPFVTHGKASGTGLGTAIVKSIVEAHHGQVTFTTRKGKGTSFYVRIPLKQPKAPKET